MSDDPANSPVNHLAGELPPKGRLLAIDHGSARIGLAICDSERMFASPLENYARRSPEEDIAYLKSVAMREQVIGLVIGLPLRPDGSGTPQSAKVQDWAEELMPVLQLPIGWISEAHTTFVAQGRLFEAGVHRRQHKGRRDAVAAQVFLQDFLDQANERKQRLEREMQRLPADKILDEDEGN